MSHDDCQTLPIRAGNVRDRGVRRSRRSALFRRAGDEGRDEGEGRFFDAGADARQTGAVQAAARAVGPGKGDAAASVGVRRLPIG